jgi:hypothetical protein
MPRIRRDRQQSIDPIVGFGDVVLRRVYPNPFFTFTMSDFHGTQIPFGTGPDGEALP